jgi:hypothetical protein
MSRYVALLRGINVGGNNLIRMPALKTCFEAQFFGDVATFIASGNVLFTARRAGQRGLTRGIEETLSKTFAYRSPCDGELHRVRLPLSCTRATPERYGARHVLLFPVCLARAFIQDA